VKPLKRSIGTMIDFLAMVILNLIGLFLAFVLADRFWGVKILGEVVPQRSTLIYEGRPWWMKGPVLFITLGVYESVVIVTSFLIFMPSALNGILTPLGTLWMILLIGIVIMVLSEH
jgi:hypothetical protein